MATPFLYHWLTTLNRSQDHSRSISWKEVQDSGFVAHSHLGDWSHLFTNDDTWVVVDNVPLSPSQTHVHVIATSGNNDSAQRWAGELFAKIRDSRLVPFD